jgi:hypothetical protein
MIHPKKGAARVPISAPDPGLSVRPGRHLSGEDRSADVALRKVSPTRGPAAVTVQSRSLKTWCRRERCRQARLAAQTAPSPGNRQPATAGVVRRSNRRRGSDAEAAGPAIDGQRPPRDIERQQQEPVKCDCLNFLSVGTISRWHGSSCWPVAWCRWRRC